MVHECIGVLEITPKGDVIKKSGEFEKKEQKELNELTKNIIYILQDVNSIKLKINNTGNFIKIRIRNDNHHYEMAIGSASIRINEYNLQ